MNKHQKLPRPVSALDRGAARQALAGLREGGALVVTNRRERHVLPPALSQAVALLLEAYAGGANALIASPDDELTTQQAADFLKLSRPTVARMMDEGRIPFRKPGKHRRVRYADLVAFEQRLRGDQEAALNELSELGREEWDLSAQVGRKR